MRIQKKEKIVNGKAYLVNKLQQFFWEVQFPDIITSSSPAAERLCKSSGKIVPT